MPAALAPFSPAPDQSPRCGLQLKLGDSPGNLFNSSKVLMASRQGRRLGYHKPEQASNPESRLSTRCLETRPFGPSFKRPLFEDTRPRAAPRRRATRSGGRRCLLPDSPGDWAVGLRLRSQIDHGHSRAVPTSLKILLASM